MTMDQLMRSVKSENSLPVEQKKEVIKHLFADFAIDPRILKNILQKGYDTPTPIQDQAIPHLLEGKDVIGLANTGTGKTAAFLIPLINKILADRKQNVIIMAPTRELAVQIEKEFHDFTKGMGLSSLLCIGGTSMGFQIRKARMPYHILIGTPGRIIDLGKRGLIAMSRFQNVVLDEADRMVDMGFIDDIKLIFSKLINKKQTMFFTATLKREVEGLVHQFLVNPVKVSVKMRDTAANVEQKVVKVMDMKKKMEVLEDLLRDAAFERVLIFGRTKFGVEKICRTLKDKGFRVDSIHGDKSQSYRLKALNSFKGGIVKILVATDVAARGLDIDNVSHVINYDLPASYEDYIHRIGRTGRAQKKGVALSLVSAF